MPFLFLATSVLLWSGCTATRPQTAREYGPANEITAEQIRESFGANAYEIVEQSRARWLLTTQGPVTVYLDERHLGGAGALRQVQKREIDSIRYFPFSRAIGRFPRFTGGSGVVQVVSRRDD